MMDEDRGERPEDARALIAVDLGAESCRVSLLRWSSEGPKITLVERFANAPRWSEGGLRWDVERILQGVEQGIKRAAEIAREGVRSIAVDGWAVDYVRLNHSGRPISDPYCYRDERTVNARKALHKLYSPHRLRELTGVQLLRINTIYQLYADRMEGLAGDLRWVNLPEYVLMRLGGRRIAEYTNATHTGMVELYQRQWCAQVFAAAGLDLSSAPPLVPPGSRVGVLTGELAKVPGLEDVALIAPACHDTASAIAGIPAAGHDWAYISSGTWSLVGTLLDEPRNGTLVGEETFTNLGAVGGKICFHKNVNGMWLLRQCMEDWARQGTEWDIEELVTLAERALTPVGLLDVDDPEFLLAGGMLERLHAHLARSGQQIDVSAENAPAIASLIFHSLAARYAEVLKDLAAHSGKMLKRLYVVGGGSRNVFLNRLTAETTGLEVLRGAVESSTIGNFAVQLAALDGSGDPLAGVHAEDVVQWAVRLVAN